MYYIYLDDLRWPKTDYPWEICRSVKEFKDAIIDWYIAFYGSAGDLGTLILSFDHDLCDDDEPTGYDAVKWLAEFCLNKNINVENIKLNVHSANPVGRKNIESYWMSFKKHCTDVPY